MRPTFSPFEQENSSSPLPPNDHLEEINKVIEPKRLFIVWSRILLLILMIIALITITSVCWKNFTRLDSHLTREIKREEVVSFKRDWFVAKNQEIEGLKHQIKTAKAALASIEEQRKSTWISRESDREIYNRTLERLMALEASLMAAIKEYNSTLSIANPSDIAGLNSAVAD
jgi:hypothetical protein